MVTNRAERGLATAVRALLADANQAYLARLGRVTLADLAKGHPS